ncbi:MAG: rRNA maturation RNase YbeY [Clostridia bacterium]|nr:rRNA maturation RNase YbeY [Clostridia bacterium]
MEKAKVHISNEQKDVKLPAGIKLLLRKACNAVLILEEFQGNADVYVTLVNGETIHELNLKHRNVDAPTDVLSFPLGEGGVYDIDFETGNYQLGDIVISVPRAVQQAEEYGHSLQREMAYLTVHSMLHLLGYDHVNGGMEAVRMREHEEAVMMQLGLPRNESYVMEEQ